MPIKIETRKLIPEIINIAFFLFTLNFWIINCVTTSSKDITQFIIQKFKVNRKKAILIISGISFLVSILIGISLGYAINEQDKLTLMGHNLLDFLDLVSNTVLMPVCAIGSCFALGWFLDKKFTFNPMKTLASLQKEGFNIGGFGKIFVVMLKYVTPVLILVIEIFGVKDLIFPKGVFDINGLGIVLTAYALLFICIAIYFIFLKNKETGTNEDEFLISDKSE